MRLLPGDGKFQGLLNEARDLLPDGFGISVGADNTDREVIRIPRVEQPFVSYIERVSTRNAFPQPIHLSDCLLDCLKFLVIFLLSLQHM